MTPALLTLCPEQTGYIAGVLDAHGHLSIVKTLSARPGVRPGYAVRTVLRMRDPTVLEAIAAMIPGGRVVAVRHRSGHRGQDYKLRIPPGVLLDVLRAICPLLRRQRRTVELILRLTELRRLLVPAMRETWTQEASAIFAEYQFFNRRNIHEIHQGRHRNDAPGSRSH